MTVLTRRRFLQSGLAAAATVSFGPGFWRNAVAAAPPAQPDAVGPYGALLAPDANGIMLPPGFTSRVIARGGQPVPGTGYSFPPAPDGQATFPTPDDVAAAIEGLCTCVLLAATEQRLARD